MNDINGGAVILVKQFLEFTIFVRSKASQKDIIVFKGPGVLCHEKQYYKHLDGNEFLWP